MKDIVKKIKEEKYSVIGVRSIWNDEQYNVGDLCRPSYDWNFEYDVSTFDTDSPIQLNGTCASLVNIDEIGIAEAIEKALDFNAQYGGKQILIAGYEYEHGHDANEIIIKDAEVIGKF